MRKSRKVAIAVLIPTSLILAGFLLYVLNWTGTFFKVPEWYDGTNLNYAGVPFADPSDIHAWNEGYSTSDACPWGFEHNGLDFFFNNSAPVLAIVPGQIWGINDYDGEGENKYHLKVYIRFNSTVKIEYGFEPWTAIESNRDLQRSMLTVQEGDWVQKGDVIGHFLALNESAHIHMGFEENGEDICPQKFFSPDGYATMMALIHTYQPWDMCY